MKSLRVLKNDAQKNDAQRKLGSLLRLNASRQIP